jgi:hypothetical protein
MSWPANHVVRQYKVPLHTYGYIAPARVGATIFPETVSQWISVAIAAITALLVWLRQHSIQLGVLVVKKPPPPTPDADM